MTWLPILKRPNQARLAVAVCALGVAISTCVAEAAPRGNGKIAFAGELRRPLVGSSPHGIYAVNPDGSESMLVTPAGTLGGRPVWSPDGSRLAFLVGEHVTDFSPRGALWVANADGSGRRLLADDAGNLSWSPDGARIAFTGGLGVHVVRVADGQVVRLGTGTGGAPSWSSDGTQLVYAEASLSGLSIVDSADGSPIRKLEITGADAPAWSPDGTMIAFIKRTPGTLFASGHLTVIRPDGSGLATIWPGLLSPSPPAWSPDGTRLVLDDPRGSSHSGSATFLHPRDVLMAAVDGSRKTGLTRGRGGFSPAWSPDGTKIAFTSTRSGLRQVFVVNADGTCPTQLTKSGSAVGVKAEAHTPSWQPVTGAPVSPPIRCADLALATKARAAVGAVRSVQLIRFTLENIGNDPATGVEYVVRLPRTLASYGDQGAACRIGRHAITCKHPRAEVGVAWTIEFAVRLVRPGRGTIRVYASAGEFDGDRSNNEIRLSHEVSRCTALGGKRSDLLIGTSRADVICGEGGADRILGLGGADHLLGGDKSDAIVPGTGRDVVDAGRGPDLVRAHDGVPDRIACGAGRDRVLADRSDLVGRDCERVVLR